jgi:plasmid replication initiation protein
MISAEGVFPDPTKLDSIRDWPAPSTATEMRSFLGLTNYLRDFIPRYTELTAPLEPLKLVSTSFSLNDEQSASFKNVKTNRIF